MSVESMPQYEFTWKGQSRVLNRARELGFEHLDNHWILKVTQEEMNQRILERPGEQLLVTIPQRPSSNHHWNEIAVALDQTCFRLVPL